LFYNNQLRANRRVNARASLAGLWHARGPRDERGSTMTVPEYNLQEVVTESRVRGLWRLMHGFRFIYLVANLAVGVAALSRSAFAYLIRYLVDDVLGTPQAGRLLPWVALGFIGLALLQGAFTFLSGKLAARTAEGVVLRLRNYLYDH